MESRQVVLGIDVGGTNTVMGLVDEDGGCYLKSEIPTNGHLPASSLFKRLFECFEEKIEPVRREFELLGIGFGAPTANYYKGTVENPNNLNWGCVNIVNMIRQYYALPVAVINDANAAAIGEMKYGAAKNFKNFIEITLGTGLGSGIIVNGELVHGQDGFAGEIGHTIIVENGRLCGCGRKGCLETYVSANGIRRTAFELLSVLSEKSCLSDYSYNLLTSKIIYEAALKGDLLAQKAFEITGRRLGFALSNTVAHLNPEAIILFGGLSLAGEMLLEPVKHFMEENLLEMYKGRIKLLQSNLMTSENAAILGTSAIIWHDIKTKGSNGSAHFRSPSKNKISLANISLT
ncbi:MAG: ROK family protein [Methanococcaceae archaeon]